jgi:hypothetical protein
MCLPIADKFNKGCNNLHEILDVIINERNG